MSAIKIVSETTLDTLSQEDFSFFKEKIESLAGIHLSDIKRDLVESRLRSRTLQLGFKKFSEYRRHLSEIPPGHSEWEFFINLLTTNKTEFFREPEHFRLLQERLIPQWLNENEETYKVWCAAASTGEEPYTLSMILQEEIPAGKKFEILATDIDTEVLKKAKNGVYPKSKIHEVPAGYKKYFELGKGEIADWVRVKSSLRQSIRFQNFNLIGKGAAPASNLDIIFCRNVLIYFSPSTIELALDKLYQATKPGGYLIIGHTESIHNLQTPWKRLKPSIYIKE